MGRATRSLWALHLCSAFSERRVLLCYPSDTGPGTGAGGGASGLFRHVAVPACLQTTRALFTAPTEFRRPRRFPHRPRARIERVFHFPSNLLLDAIAGWPVGLHHCRKTELCLHIGLGQRRFILKQHIFTLVYSVRDTSRTQDRPR